MYAAPIRLFSTLPAFGLPSPSPACVKLELWLRMQQLPYTKELVDLSVAPKGKMPYAELDGELVGDSTLIIEHLKRSRGINPEAGLSPTELAIAIAFRRSLKEHFYWVITYERWINEENFAAYAPALGAALLPSMTEADRVAFIRGYREPILQQLHAQGIGRHTPAEVHSLGIADVRAVADYLGDKHFFMGDAPTSVDATVFAYMANMLLAPYASPVRDAGRSCDKLMAYLDRMAKAYLDPAEE